MSGTDYVTTPNLGLYKPISNRAVGTWGDLWNANADALDAAIAGSGASVVNVLDHGAKGDGITDDTAAIQATLNTYAGKAVVFLPDTGHPYMVSTLLAPTGTDLLIHGTLMAKANAGTLLEVSGTSNVTVRGHGSLDGNGTNQTGVQAAFYVANATNVQLSGLTLQNSHNWNLNVVASSRVRVVGVSMIGGVNANEFAGGCDDCLLEGCSINGPSGDPGFAFYGGVTNSKAIGNTIKNAAGSGVNILCDSPQPVPCKNITIADNTIFNCGASGITANVGTGGTGKHSGVMINGNVIYANNASNNANGAGIFLDFVQDVDISGNSLTDGGTFACKYGVWLNTNAASITMSGNAVFNIGSAARAGGGLFVASCPNVQADGNTFYDDRATPYMTNAIGGTAGTQNAFINNTVGPLAGSTPIIITPTTDTALGNALLQPTLFSSWAFGFGSAVTVTITRHGIIYNGVGGTHEISFTWNGTATALQIDGSAQGNVLTDKYVAGRPNVANDAAAAAAGVPVGGVYLNGSALQVRVS